MTDETFRSSPAAAADIASSAASDTASHGGTHGAASLPVTGTEEAAAGAAPLRSGRHTSWDALPLDTPAQGLERRMLVGERLMICRLHFAPHTVTPIHHHPHEQMTLIEQGRFRFTIAGDERIAVPGDVLHFPPHVEHGATCLDEPGVLVDIFTPIREDFLPRG